MNPFDCARCNEPLCTHGRCRDCMGCINCARVKLSVLGLALLIGAGLAGVIAYHALTK